MSQEHSPILTPPSAPFRGTLDVPVLAQSLPSDVASFRALCAKLEALEDEVGSHLDAFSCVAFREDSDIDRRGLVELFRRRRRDLELAVLVLSPKLDGAPVRSIFPGYLLAKLTQDALGRRSSEALGALLTQLEQRAPLAWERLIDRLHAVVDATDNWRRWPDPEVARAAADALQELAVPWADVVPSLRRKLGGGHNRERRRDPAYRRAVNWHSITLSLFQRLAVPGGPLRIITDYYFAVIAYFEAAIANPTTAVPSNHAGCDLLILEIFGMLEQFSLCDDELPDNTPRFLEQGVTRRRKRIQRARLQVLMRWQVFVDDVTWVEWVYPALRRISQLRDSAREDSLEEQITAPERDDALAEGRRALASPSPR